MNRPNKIIIHCADTPNGKAFTPHDIDAWHDQRGFRRTQTARHKFNPQYKSGGYHFVIGVNGERWTMRHTSEIGAHCKGENEQSIGICLFGRGKYTEAQFEALILLLNELRDIYGDIPVTGHYEYPSAQEQGKLCPNFDVQMWVASGYYPNPAITCEAKA